MIIPVRCISCGKPIAGMWDKFKERVGKGDDPGKVLDELGITRYCCRSMFLTNKDILKKVARYRV